MVKRHCLHRMQASPQPQQKAWVTGQGNPQRSPPLGPGSGRDTQGGTGPRLKAFSSHTLPSPTQPPCLPTPPLWPLHAPLFGAVVCVRLAPGCPPSLLGPGLSSRGERPLEEEGGGRTQPQQPGQAEPHFGKVHRSESFPCPPSKGAGRLTHRGRQPEPPATVLPSPRSSPGSQSESRLAYPAGPSRLATQTDPRPRFWGADWSGQNQCHEQSQNCF